MNERNQSECRHTFHGQRLSGGTPGFLNEGGGSDEGFSLIDTR